MIKSFVSAGHHDNDSGATANELKEADLTKEFRDLVIVNLEKIGANYSKDQDSETLGQYLQRIKPGNGSVVVEFHFDFASDSKTGGTTAVVADNASSNSKAFAKELADATSRVLGVKNKGVIPETQTYRKRLGLMRKEGIVALLEIGFISNASDIEKYNVGKEKLAAEIAKIIKKYDDLI